VPAEEAVEKIGDPVGEQHPHDGDMPRNSARQPSAEGHPARKREGQAGRRVV